MELKDAPGKLEQCGAIAKDPHQLMSAVALATEAAVKQALTSGPTRAIKTGNLRRSIHARIDIHDARVGTNVDYAPYVHGGTKYMKPRPFFDAGIQHIQDNLDQMLGGQAKLIFEPMVK